MTIGERVFISVANLAIPVDSVKLVELEPNGTVRVAGADGEWCFDGQDAEDLIKLFNLKKND